MAFAWSAAYLFIWPGANEWWAVIPFILMATKGVDITVVNGLFLSALWMSYTLLITSPLYVLVGRYIVLLIYLPIIGVVFYKQPHQPADPLFLLLESVFWDFPLICWMRLISKMNGRALKPFYSEITEELAVGSMPLEIDVQYLHEVKNIGLVVNMCREYPGPLEEYAKRGIQQVHLPTPDVCEPDYNDVLRGVQAILQYLDAQRSPATVGSDGSASSVSKGNSKVDTAAREGLRTAKAGTAAAGEPLPPADSPPVEGTDEIASSSTTLAQRGVFIHCKAGRGRAATMALCYLIASTEITAADAMKLILERRSVVEPSVRKFRVVKKFVQRLEYYNYDFDTLFLHDYVLGGSIE
jgi:protein-tyrosine phosphatase